MHRLILAKTGWGKSYYSQAVIEVNIPKYDITVLFDPKDEYRGLVKAGYLKHFIVGPAEAGWSTDQWQTFLGKNPRVVLAKYRLGTKDWQQVAVRVTRAVRRLCRAGHTGLLAFDEAHNVAEQHSLPEELGNLATTGRGEGASSIWITQRAAKLDEDIISQCGERLLGGFTSDADLDKLRKVTEYPMDIHNPSAATQTAVPDELKVDGKGIPLRRFEDDNGNTTGSEWIFSDDYGEIERRDTSNVSMQSTHYGPEGQEIADP
ncbi:helicase HerA domain-containing protein [Halosimplex amylolyticum]|uniref:helicase HerA domain-containing protein n=1 Tax=Halosimplex amylolyticum TaxID=3396616 RepID=UPI003F57D41E